MIILEFIAIMDGMVNLWMVAMVDIFGLNAEGAEIYEKTTVLNETTCIIVFQ